MDVEIRHTPLTPTFKLYLFNGVEALHGPYEVINRKIMLDSDEEVMALDVLGLGATLTHHVKDADRTRPARSSWTAWRSGSNRSGSCCPSSPGRPRRHLEHVEERSVGLL
ncbi:hypothetical protein SALBM311S_01836 [Streptomyces alboniger]